MKLVIGLVGEKGSGKETFGNLLQGLLPDKMIVRIRSSDILAETLALWDLPKTRANLQNLAIIMDKQFGDGSVSHAVNLRINQTQADIVLFDGVRWATDVEVIRSFPKHKLVYITAPLKLRFDRLKLRKEKTYEETTSFAQFLKEEEAKNELDIPKIGSKADFKILNDGSLDELKAKVEEFLASL